jgi:uncharacterized membrane protein YhaH (DUF805 family)
LGFVEAVKTDFSKYAVFSGRAGGPEYWYFVLLHLVCVVLAVFLDVLAFPFLHVPVFLLIEAIAFVVPHFAVGCRRLHDTGHSGWWFPATVVLLVAAPRILDTDAPLGILLSMASVMMMIVLLIWLSNPGTTGPNRFGD